MQNASNFNEKFGIDQLIAASEAARNFSGLRKSAKIAPRLILENNRPDSVILSVEDYQLMQATISTLQEELFKLQTIARIVKNENEGIIKHKFDDFATEEDKIMAKETANWDISDDELFE